MLQEYKYKKMISELGKDRSSNSPINKEDLYKGRQNNVHRLNKAYNNAQIKKSVKFEVRHLNKN